MTKEQEELQRAHTINALLSKANSLAHEAQVLRAAGPHQSNPALFQQKEATAQQESYYCSAKASALQAGSAYSYPGPAVIQQVLINCQKLEQAINTSAGWTVIIAAGDALAQTMQGNSV